MLITANSTRRLFYMKRTKSKHPTKKHATRRTAQDCDAISPSKVCKAMLLTVAVGIALLLPASLLAYFYKEPTALLPVCGLGASALTAFLGGMIAGRIHRHSLLTVGLLNGVLITVLMLVLSLFFQSESSHYPAWASALLHAAFLLLSALGALTTPPQKTKRKKHKK